MITGYRKSKQTYLRGHFRNRHQFCIYRNRIRLFILDFLLFSLLVSHYYSDDESVSTSPFLVFEKENGFHHFCHETPRTTLFIDIVAALRKYHALKLK